MLAYRIEPTDRLVIITGAGALKAAEALDVQNAIRADPAFERGFALLTDYLEVTDLDFDAQDLRRMVVNSPFGPEAPRAYVARADLAFGLLRMFHAFNDPRDQRDRIKVFRDIQAAQQWLREMRAE